MKKNGGITLIALIITIVVLLILVATTLIITLGENGIILKVREAKASRDIEQKREELLSIVAGAYNNEGVLEVEKVKEVLQANGIEEIEGEDFSLIVSYKGTKFEIKRLGEVLIYNEELPQEELFVPVYAENDEDWVVVDDPNLEGYVIINDYVGSNKENLVIPNIINGKRVSNVKKIVAKTSLTGGITISKGITQIGSSLFSGCTGLTSISLPNSGITIGDSSFSGCTGITEIEIPDNTVVGKTAFSNCTNVTDIIIGNNVELKDCSGTPQQAFYNCTTVTNITIGNHCYIGGYAFCEITATITINGELEGVGASAFKSCTGLTGTISLSNSITTIESHAFYKCTGLTSISIPNSVTTINIGAFGLCTGLTNISLPSSGTNIKRSAFTGCTGITEIQIPDNTVLGMSVFYNCTNLTNIIIGNNVVLENGTNSLYEMFKGATNVTNITIGNDCSIGDYAFYRKTSTITINGELKGVGKQAFNSCTGLTGDISLSNSVTTIGDMAFSGCTGLASISIPSSVTTIGSNAFVNVPSVIAGNQAVADLITASGYTGTITIDSSIN